MQQKVIVLFWRDNSSNEGNTQKETYESREEFLKSYWNDKLVDFGVENEEGTLVIELGLIRTNILTNITREGCDGEYWISSNGRVIYDEDEVVWSELMERHILRDYAHWTFDYDECATQDWFCNNDYAIPEDGDHWAPMDELYYCEGCEQMFYEYCENDCCYEEETNDAIASYHNTDGFAQDLSKTSMKRVGYEIEKEHFEIDESIIAERGDFIGENALFRGYEEDSSCGVEAITHILPLDRGYFDEVKAMMNERVAKQIINSPTNKTCGGHISISYKGMNGLDLMNKMRGDLSIIYGMFPNRLRDTYCKGNKRMVEDSNVKFSPIFVKSSYIELRLPSRVLNVKQLFLRHKLVSELMEHSINGDGRFETLISNVRPLLKTMYGRDSKVDNVISLATSFRKWLLTDEVDKEIYTYVKDEVVKAKKDARIEKELKAIVLALSSSVRKAKAKLGSYFLLPTTIGRLRIEVRNNGLYFARENKLIDFDPNELSFTTTTFDGFPIVWNARDVGYRMYQPAIESLEREPKTYRPSSRWGLSVRNNILTIERGLNSSCYVSYLEGDVITCKENDGNEYLYNHETRSMELVSNKNKKQ